MGAFINIGNAAFQSARNSEYVDKSGLIAQVNSTLFTNQRFSCVSRCRRFGTSMAAQMLCAYYDKSCDSRTLFADLEIASNPSFEQHLNKYPVIYLDLTSFVSLENPNLLYALVTTPVKIGTASECFVVNQLSHAHKVEYGKAQGDFKVDGIWTFEVGRENKSYNQIAGLPNSFVLGDDIESPRGNKLPLWLLGFLY